MSHKSAWMAEKMGYTNVKVFEAGYPGWLRVKGNYGAVTASFVKKQLDKSAAMTLIDSRPTRTRYNKGHIPTAINIPYSQFDKYKNRLPRDKTALLVFYCQGFT